MSGPSESTKRKVKAERARASTIATMNLIKLGGGAAAFNELVIRANTTPWRAGLAALMIMVGQLTEGVILGIIDRVLGRPVPSESDE